MDRLAANKIFKCTKTNKEQNDKRTNKMNEQQYEWTHIQVDKWITSKWTSDKG